jgi:hypothetical protein
MDLIDELRITAKIFSHAARDLIIAGGNFSVDCTKNEFVSNRHEGV